MCTLFWNMFILFLAERYSCIAKFGNYHGMSSVCVGLSVIGDASVSHKVAQKCNLCMILRITMDVNPKRFKLRAGSLP